MPTYAVSLVVLVVAVVLGIVLARLWRVRELMAGLVVVLLTLLLGGAILWAAWPPQLGVDFREGEILVYAIQEADAATAPEVREPLREKLVATVTRRVNPGAVQEVTVRQRGPQQLEIMVPESGSAAIDRLKRIVPRVGALELHVLANQRDDKLLIEQAQAEEGAEVHSDGGQLLARWVPVAKAQEAVLRKYPELVTRSVQREGQAALEVLMVHDEQRLTGADLLWANAVGTAHGKAVVRFALKASGGQRLHTLVGSKLPDEVGSFTRKLGVILDGQLCSTSVIKEVRSDGEIANDFSEQEARDWADVLNAGALPIALSAEPVQQWQSGPTVGREGVSRLVVAAVVGLALVLLLLVAVYRGAGLAAGVLLLANLALVLAVMTTVKTGLTLSVLAGLALVVAIAVGTSVLLLERTREELERQTALRMAIRNGFSKGTGAVLASTGAVLLVASILVLTGTVVFKAFAVAVWLGTVVSLLANFYGLRVILELAERRRWISQLAMRRIPLLASEDYLNKPWRAGLLSAVLIVASLAGVGLRVGHLLDTDLAGGVSTEVVFREPQEIATVRSGLAAFPGITVVEVCQAGEAFGQRFLISGPVPPGQAAEDYLGQLQAAIPQAFSGKLIEEPGTASKMGTTIDSRVPATTRDQAGYALAVSLVCVFGLLWIRYRWVQYGLVALLVLLHDGLLVLGTIAFSQWLAPYLGFLRIEEFRLALPVMAAVLAILGISLSNLIGLFERVRELRSKAAHLVPEKVNVGLGSTLQRTLISALAMLLVAIVLYALGGPGLHAVAFALLVGTLVSTYSARYVTGPLLFWLSRPPAATAVPVKAPSAKPRASRS